MNINNILIKAHITEKTMANTANQVYCFQVNKNATKHQIKKSVEDLFKVKVFMVHTYIKKGKKKRKGKKMIASKNPDTKIAFITVSQGKIDLFPATK